MVTLLASFLEIGGKSVFVKFLPQVTDDLRLSFDFEDLGGCWNLAWLSEAGGVNSCLKVPEATRLRGGLKARGCTSLPLSSWRPMDLSERSEARAETYLPKPPVSSESSLSFEQFSELATLAFDLGIDKNLD